MQEAIFVRQVDKRSSFRGDDQYPNLIFLSTVLRWVVTGNVVIDASSDCNSERIVDNNNKALASVAALLADHIENGSIPILNVHTKLLIGVTEKTPILARLRTMDGTSNVDGLIDEDGQDYYLGGRELYRVFVESVANISDDQKGGLWYRLAFDAPSEWRAIQASGTSPTTNVLSAKQTTALTKQPIINAFEGVYWSREQWSKYLASPPQWLTSCRVAKGNKTVSATWSPVSIGLALRDKGVVLKRLDLVFMGLKDWKDEWQESTELMR